MLKPLQIVIYVLLTCVYFTACKDKKIANDIIVVQPDIISNRIYMKLDKSKEPIDPWILDTTKMKPRTSDVLYISNRGSMTLSDTSYAHMNNCRAYIDSGRLKIDIGSHGMFGGHGFDIICTKNKYTIIPYLYNDQPGIKKPKSTYQINSQSLILNKAKYTLGDSIFGYVDFNLIENQQRLYNEGILIEENKKITHIGKGYFRGKVEKSN